MVEMILFLLPPFVACTILLGLLGYFGIHILEREIIFIDIALAQIAAVGSTIAAVIFGFGEESMVTYACAFGLTLLASLFFAQIDKRIHQITHEAIIGVSYAIAAAAALFILALSAGHDVHMENMLTGSILWAKWTDILWCGLLFGAVGLFHFIYRKKFILVSTNSESAKKEGVRVPVWDFLFYASMGLVITYSVKIAGVLVIFTFLIIPGTLSALFSRSLGKRLLIAYGAGLLAILCGLTFSYKLDFSCGPSVVSFLGLALILSAVFSRRRLANE